MNKSSFIQLLADLVTAIKAQDISLIARKKRIIDAYIGFEKPSIVHNYAKKQDLTLKIEQQNFNDKWRNEYGYLPIDDESKV